MILLFLKSNIWSKCNTYKNLHYFTFACISLSLIILQMLIPSVLLAGSCIDRSDTFNDYDNRVNFKDINDVPSQYYLLSYSWAPRFCDSVSVNSKQKGQKNFLQCGSDSSFGYILHGLWPQGSTLNRKGYPRACKGDQAKISRKILEPYLCMTPSVWLLQHEYEYHGTCMPNNELSTPQGYFNQAKSLHEKLTLPRKMFDGNKENIKWLYDNNHDLVEGSIQYSQKSKEWQFCFNNRFKSSSCPSYSQNEQVDKGKSDGNKIEKLNRCLVKGNISKKSKKHLYFIVDHPDYKSVKISFDKGEKCFSNEQEALDAGWVKAG